MSDVLISIQPKWVEKICHKIGEASGKPIYEKEIEVRKDKPTKVNVPFKCLIYETQGATETPWADEDGHLIFKGKGAIIGEFTCDRIIEWECKNRLELVGELGLPNWRASYMCFVDDIEKACLTYEDLWNYGNGKTLYGWHISDLKIYDKPKELSGFRKRCKYFFDNEIQGCITGDKEFIDCGYNDFADCLCNGLKPLTRPPQSWCYVEGQE